MRAPFTHILYLHLSDNAEGARKDGGGAVMDRDTGQTEAIPARCHCHCGQAFPGVCTTSFSPREWISWHVLDLLGWPRHQINCVYQSFVLSCGVRIYALSPFFL